MRGSIRCALVALTAAPGAAHAPKYQPPDISPVHDPAILADRGRFLLMSTGHVGSATGLLPLRVSPDLRRWTRAGASFLALPAWAERMVPGTRGMWAPDLSRVGGEYRLYYSLSAFGKNRSAIGLAVADRIDAAAPATHWIDKGPVIASRAGDDFNAIDPAAFVDATGRQWLAFGSFWSGIKLIELDPASGLRRAGTPMRAIAARSGTGAIEAPFVIRRGGFYYLFASFDFCCRGAASTYRTVVGRARAPTGPYVDRAGVAMLAGGGTTVLPVGRGTRFVGRGHVAILQAPGGDRIVYHAYDTQRRGAPTLRIQRLDWDAQGWPIAR